MTGATGQIGSELVPNLRKRYGRDNVVASGHIRRPTKEMEDSGPFLTLDLMDQEAVSETIRAGKDRSGIPSGARSFRRWARQDRRRPGMST